MVVSGGADWVDVIPRAVGTVIGSGANRVDDASEIVVDSGVDWGDVGTIWLDIIPEIVSVVVVAANRVDVVPRTNRVDVIPGANGFDVVPGADWVDNGIDWVDVTLGAVEIIWINGELGAIVVTAITTVDEALGGNTVRWKNYYV